MKTQQVISAASLGICEHCGVVLTIEGMPAEAIDAEWICPNCKKVLSQKSFGYETVEGKPKKVRWVGKGGKWVPTQPTQDFDLGEWNVTPRPIVPFWS